MTLEGSSDEHVQAMRRVYENANPTDSPSPNDIFHVTYHLDPATGKGIILWDDILSAFKNVVHVRTGTMILSFLKGSDFKKINTENSMDKEQSTTETPAKEISVKSLHKALPGSPQEQSTADFNNNNNPTNVIRRNPAYGLVEEAMQNYNHIENPASATIQRRPQLIPDNQSSPLDDDNDSKAQRRSSKKYQQNARAPQENASIAAKDFTETLIKASQGDKHAQVDVGDMYRDGQGVIRDYQAAMDWYLKAAEQKNPVGQRRAGSLHNSGLGVPQSYSTAMEWFLLAAEQGDSHALRIIGSMYLYGRGVPQDHSKAMNRFRKAANQGNVAAHQNIGWLYERGLGVPQDFGKAMEWYCKAADLGDADAQSNIGFLYNCGLGVPQDDAQAAEWYQKAAEQGVAAAQYSLGNMLYHGRGIPENKAKAREWYKKAANQGYIPE
ncbi:hypothetical protein BGZ96_012818 [Linnemannia gamsii]|uniref:HCP-like protein n=1 Tax=Linnemannia gamsii TaxID=64522 RepID=A0ABQ7JPX2_9FUNG|nr:hypothetical protein BGZ96_012818 [Linnemannia gamsii]